MKLSFRLLPLACLGLLSLIVCAVAQSSPDYDALVQQGKAQLQAGNNDAALASANAAIKLDTTRWQAYAVAGGALINLKRYEEAADQFGHAIDKAPEGKQAGLRDLRRQCLSAETVSTSATGANAQPVPSQGTGAQNGPPLQEILAWIQSNLQKYTMVRGFKDSQELTFQGCMITLTDTLIVPDRPASKYGKTTVQIDLTRLSPDSVTTATDSSGTWIVFHSDQEFTRHTTDWIKSVDAISRHETVPDQLVVDDEQSKTYGYPVTDADMAGRHLRAWHDAIAKCAAKAVPAHLY
jgi:hypothetical protein